MKTVDQHREEFEKFYRDQFKIRHGARGKASNHLDMYNGAYISDHAAMCWVVWLNSAMENSK